MVEPRVFMRIHPKPLCILADSKLHQSRLPQKSGHDWLLSPHSRVKGVSHGGGGVWRVCGVCVVVWWCVVSLFRSSLTRVT